MSHETVIILDFGSQVTQLIARRVREGGVYCEILPFSTPLAVLQQRAPKAIILSGGPSSVTESNAPRIDAGVFEMGIPILGICYGQQLMCDMLGGKVESVGSREFGRAFVDIVTPCALFGNTWQQDSRHQVWMSHGDKVTALPAGFEVVARSEGAPFAVIAHTTKPLYGVQFHPEVAHTPDGAALLRHFTHDIAGCKGDWSMHGFIEEACARVRAQVGNERVICAVSGGVDSSVVAALLHRALGDQLHCIFVDTGLLRQAEVAQVVSMFRDLFHIPLRAVDASARFMERLHGVSDPEQKRKIIGATFIDVFEAEEAAIGGAAFLAQGTLYPDVIESISFHGGPSVTIKSHHNVGGLPERMNMQLVEPVRELFKDEVRALGRALGMPEVMVDRHPFPGPGLAIRILGEITEAKLELLRKADAIYIEEIRAAGLYDAIWQAFEVLLPVQTVGVMGDGRTYEYVCALRAVTSVDGMTADYYPFDHAFLSRVSSRIVNEVRGINRVVYDVTSKPPATIEWE